METLTSSNHNVVDGQFNSSTQCLLYVFLRLLLYVFAQNGIEDGIADMGYRHLGVIQLIELGQYGGI